MSFSPDDKYPISETKDYLLDFFLESVDVDLDLRFLLSDLDLDLEIFILYIYLIVHYIFFVDV